MKSYTQLRTLYGKLTLDVSSDNLTLGDELMNDEYRTACAEKDWSFLHRARTLTTTASTQFKPLPYDIDLVESVFVTVSSQRYTPKILHSREEWDLINGSVVTSDIPEYAFVYNGEIGLYPTPASSSNVVTVNGKVRVIDLINADLTAQQVAITTATTAVVGTGTSWRRGITGSWMRIALNSSSDTTSGDHEWYEISAVGSTTAITLVRTYNGGTVAVGVATIGQMPLTPSFAHEMPVYSAAATYWYSNGNSVKGDNFMKIHDRKRKALDNYSSAVSDPVLWDGEDENVINPNLTVNL